MSEFAPSCYDVLYNSLYICRCFAVVDVDNSDLLNQGSCFSKFTANCQRFIHSGLVFHVYFLWVIECGKSWEHGKNTEKTSLSPGGLIMTSSTTYFGQIFRSLII